MANYQEVDPSALHPYLTQRKMQEALLQQQLANQMSQQRMPYIGNEEKEKLLAAQLANQGSKAKLPYIGPQAQADLNYTNSNINRINTMTPLEAQHLGLENKWYGPKAQQDISSAKALANSRALGAGLGVDAQKQMTFLQNVAKDNPNLPPERIREIANAILQNKNNLEDGTPINSSALTQWSKDTGMKARTTGPLVTANIKAKQAEAELGVLSDYAKKGLAPYGNTVSGYSPAQIMDTFRSDKQSQLKLGKFIASQALQYEIAQNRIKLANGQAGVESTRELMDLAQQQIKARYPRLSNFARQSMTEYMDKALKEGAKARLGVGIGASNAEDKTQKNNKATLRYNPQTDDFEEI